MGEIRVCKGEGHSVHSVLPLVGLSLNISEDVSRAGSETSGLPPFQTRFIPEHSVRFSEDSRGPHSLIGLKANATIRKF